eukprot:1000472-Amphidinium_carterae.1
MFTYKTSALWRIATSLVLYVRSLTPGRPQKPSNMLKGNKQRCRNALAGQLTLELPITDRLRLVTQQHHHQDDQHVEMESVCSNQSSFHQSAK